MGGSVSATQASSKTKAVIPEHLRPFVDQVINTSGDALGAASAAASGDQFADLNPDQLAALQSARDVAGGAGGFLPTAQKTALDAAKGGGVGNFLPPELVAQLQSGGGGTNVGGGIGDPSRDALEATARGDFLHGGEGFNAAVEAAQRQAQPGILSAFGGAGAGGASSGLAQAAIGRSAVDAFASQFGQERKNQLDAAGRLGGFGLERRGQDIGARSGDLDRSAEGAGLLAGLGGDERDRQLQAARELPGLGLLDSKILGDVGSQLQGQAQSEIDKPRENQLELLRAALAGIGGTSDLLGSKTKEKSVSASASFG